MTTTSFHLHNRTSRALLFLLMSTLLSACGLNNVSAPEHNVTPAQSPTPVQSPITTQKPVVLVPSPKDCPAANTVRPMLKRNLTPGSRQELVYVDGNEQGDALKRYEPASGSVATLVQLAAGYQINTIFVSQNGTWILFTVVKDFRFTQLNLIRIDGQYLQTLYCGSISSVELSWSPDMRYVAIEEFEMDGSQPVTLLLMDLQQGSVQPELTLPYADLSPYRWLNNTQLYLAQPTVMIYDGLLPVSKTSAIFLLDITKGPHQTMRDVQLIFQREFNVLDMTSSQIYAVKSICRARDTCPSTIFTTDMRGGSLRTIITINQLFVQNIAPINDQQLLLFVGGVKDQEDDPQPPDSLWLINTDGSNLHRLVLLGDNGSALAIADPILPRNPWKFISRDGSFYIASRCNGAAGTRVYCIGTFQSSQVKPTPAQVQRTILGWGLL